MAERHDLTTALVLLRSAEASLLHALRTTPQAGGFVTLPAVVVEGYPCQEGTTLVLLAQQCTTTALLAQARQAVP